MMLRHTASNTCEYTSTVVVDSVNSAFHDQEFLSFLLHISVGLCLSNKALFRVGVYLAAF